MIQTALVIVLECSHPQIPMSKTGTLADEEHRHCSLGEAQQALSRVSTNIETNKRAHFRYTNMSHQPSILAL